MRWIGILKKWAWIHKGNVVGIGKIDSSHRKTVYLIFIESGVFKPTWCEHKTLQESVANWALLLGMSAEWRGSGLVCVIKCLVLDATPVTWPTHWSCDSMVVQLRTEKVERRGRWQSVIDQCSKKGWLFRKVVEHFWSVTDKYINITSKSYILIYTIWKIIFLWISWYEMFANIAIIDNVIRIPLKPT